MAKARTPAGTTTQTCVPAAAAVVLRRPTPPHPHGTAQDWGGLPGDGVFYVSHSYLSEVKVTPHNEPNDVMYPMTWDLPSGCQLKCDHAPPLW